MKHFKIYLCLIFVLYCSEIFSQAYTADDCGMDGSGEISTSVISGIHKPTRSNMSNGQILADDHPAYFPVLIVTVQFKDETEDPLGIWPRNGSPTFINELIAPVKNLNTSISWWDKYNGKMISDWWQEVSRGQLHIVGEAHNIVLDFTAAQYISQYPNLGDREKAINLEIWTKLQDPQRNINWLKFDQWRKNPTTGLWEWERDNYIDMIYKIHRTNQAVSGVKPLASFEGYGYLAFHNNAQNFTYLFNPSDPTNSLKINYGFSAIGSGLTLQGHDNTSWLAYKNHIIHLMGHEHGHFLLGSSAHIKHAKMNLGTSRDFYFSPWERHKFGYIEAYETNLGSENLFFLSDFSGRDNTNPSLLKVPIRINQNLEEYFLISNRGKVSQYDIFMLGDTARGDPLRPVNEEYGKGIYIYHVPRGLEYSNSNKVDLECADGLWDWQFTECVYPDWSNTILMPFFKRNIPNFTHNDRVEDGLNSSDGITASSFQCWSGYIGVHFGYGKKHTSLIQNTPENESTDRLFTNLLEARYSLEIKGDRWDAWNVGYNEVFSPYSSPSTRDWDHNQTGLFFWLKT